MTRPGLPAYATAAAVVGLTVGLAFLLHRLMPHANLSLLFLTAVLVLAARLGLGPSLMAGILSFVAFNYFFTRPYYTLEVADDGDVATLVFFLVMAAIAGHLGVRMRREIARRRASLRRISDLYDFGRLMALTTEPELIPRHLAAHLYTSLNRPSWVGVGEQVATAPREPVADQPVPDPPPALLERARSHSDGPLSERGWTVFPLEAGNQTVGLAAVQGVLDDEAVNSARGLCEQAGVALDRTRLMADLEEARLEYETEQLRSALLSSVSHDLRTPLASVIGSATSLLEYGDVIDPKDRRELLSTIHGESRRLDRHIQNLLDMTRIGQGGLSLRRDWVDLRDIVSGAVGRLRDGTGDVEVQTSLPADLPLLWVHGALLEQALLNLLDNALRFSPPDAVVTVEARMAHNERMEIDVCDQGPGIAESDRDRVFDMFYTARRGDRGGQGTGLGLTICRAMVGAHGGEVEALPGPGGRGTRMRISLPLQRPDGAAGS